MGFQIMINSNHFLIHVNQWPNILYYYFNHLSNQVKKVRCHNKPFWGFNTQ